MMDGMSDSADYHDRQLLGDQRYFRFDIRLKDALDDLDAANRANINALLREADKIIKKQGKELDKLVKML